MQKSLSKKAKKVIEESLEADKSKVPIYEDIFVITKPITVIYQSSWR